VSIDRVDIEKVLKRLGIEAKAHGREWVALCPNREHKDRTPSWRIRDEVGSSRHGYHHCWPCGFGGSVVSLIQHVLQLEDYGDARSWLEREAPVDQKPIERVEVQIRPPSLRFRLPSGVVEAPIEEWPGPPREYFLDTRKLEAWQVDRWGVGYAIEGRLKGRLVLVSRDARGRPLRYTARSFTGALKRYLEPEPEEGAKMNAMFGEQHWPALEERHTLFLVEGAINGLALEAELPGIYFAATAGSEMRGLYGAKLATWKRVFTMSDPDKAGDRLGEEIGLGCARHTTIQRLRLEEGFDPAKMREKRPGELGAIIRSWLRKST
jgi:hypothetical protein